MPNPRRARSRVRADTHVRPPFSNVQFWHAKNHVNLEIRSATAKGRLDFLGRHNGLFHCGEYNAQSAHEKTPQVSALTYSWGCALCWGSKRPPIRSDLCFQANMAPF
eukprot:8705552-Pyramimonas_sp.AAC.2